MHLVLESNPTKLKQKQRRGDMGAQLQEANGGSGGTDAAAIFVGFTKKYSF